MKNYKFALQALTFLFISICFIACDSDFSILESDAINDDVATNFDIVNDTYDIITYNSALGPVQSNGFTINTLGLYDDAYGRVESDFVAQLTLSTYGTDFGEEIEIDSVVLNLPYFSAIEDIDEDGNITYQVDSIIGSNPINLSIYRSNYFIRDFDPNGEFGDIQAYFSNKSASTTEFISDATLEGEELTILPNPDEDEHISLNAQGNIVVSDNGFILTQIEGEGEEADTIITRQLPGIRLKLDPQFWMDNIINQQENNPTVLSNQNNFLEYFRGLYFKAEPVNGDGSYFIFNTSAASANITMFYSRKSISTTDDEDIREDASFAMQFGNSRINFLETTNDITIPDGNPDTGDTRLYLKGGEGSIAKIKLFNGEEIEDNFAVRLENDELNSFENWKTEFVETDAEGNFVSAKRLINEANLVFYVDQDILNQSVNNDPKNEPERLYLYDIDNKAPLTDFLIDITNNTLPSFSKTNHLGPLQRVDDEPTGDGVKYKFRITEHINNLLLNDSTNVELGLAVSLNVNLEGSLIQPQVQTGDDSETTSPISSILSPRGTVLHGSNTEDESKKVYLEIYYTEPNN